jgi:hypothetical protein
VFISKGIKKFKFVQKSIESMRAKAEKRKLSFKRWSRLGVAFFVWIPLPWTGAANGAIIANLEGYTDKESLLIALPAMWVGVISWTLWFDELYRFIERVGRGKTIFITVFLLAAPLVYGLINLLIKTIKNKS